MHFCCFCIVRLLFFQMRKIEKDLPFGTRFSTATHHHGVLTAAWECQCDFKLAVPSPSVFHNKVLLDKLCPHKCMSMTIACLKMSCFPGWSSIHNVDEPSWPMVGEELGKMKLSLVTTAIADIVSLFDNCSAISYHKQ